jgi:hypothetical protein
MRVLEARFHARSKSDAMGVVVGRILCDGTRASIEPAPLSAAAVAPFDRVMLLDKLEFLVGSAVGDTFHSLSALKSGYWSFVEVPDNGHHPRAA